MCGVRTHDCSVVEGYDAPPPKLALAMRQTKPGPSWAVPAVENPPSLTKVYPVVGVEPHARTIGPPQCPKSTARRTPDVGVQRLSGSGDAPAVAPTPTRTGAPKMPATAARTTATTAYRRRVIGAGRRAADADARRR